MASSRSVIGPVIFWAAAALSLALALFGLFFYIYGLSDWVTGGPALSGLNEFFAFIFVLIGAGALSAAFIAAGILLRIARWTAAPLASLWLSGLSAAHMTVSGLILHGVMGPPDIEISILIGISAAFGLGLVSLPPFLHWRSRTLTRPEGIRQ